uniref:Uncharacterized protein n=1 Tax=Candidatus Kentrum sp. LPFa TaxID=2126335 RepID=A0A450VZJ4_9GAMM|nr:MAG: hypothetical protein BECKLPF1236B_GA0070989_10136 [Candidatus Kentron sp. LPFa]
MQANVRFFYNRRNSAIDTGRRKVASDQDTQIVVDFCAMNPLRGRVKTVNDLRAAIGKSGGGILLIHSNYGYHIEFASAQNYSPPKHCVLLDGFDVVVAQTIAVVNGNEIQIAESQRLVVPVNAEASKRLSQLDEHLGWLSEDIRSLVFRTLHKPDMDTRVSKLERLLSKDPSDVSDQSFQAVSSANQLSRMFGLMLLATFLIVGVFAAGATYWLKTSFKDQLISGRAAQLEGHEKVIDTAQGKPPILDKQLTARPTTDELIGKTQSFVERLRKLRSADTTIGDLWQMHIEPLGIDPNNPWEKEKWLAMLENKGEFDTEELHSHFQWVLLKLWGLRAYGYPEYPYTIPGAQHSDPRTAWSPTASLFSEAEQYSKDWFTETQRVALQSINCRIKYNDYDSGWDVIRRLDHRFSLQEAKKVEKDKGAKGQSCADITTILPLLDKLLADLPQPRTKKE